jgi:hypothetical protein
MPHTCTVCVHPSRDAIDQALVSGETLRDIAQRCALSTHALFRHHRNHVPKSLSYAQAVHDVSRADALFTKVAALETDAKRLQGLAEDAGDIKTALQAVRELVRIIELQARLIGELDDSPTVNVLVLPEWTALRARILHSLLPFPDARAALADILIESNGHAPSTIPCP